MTLIKNETILKNRQKKLKQQQQEIKNFLEKTKKFIGHKRKIRPLKEPIMLFITNSGKIIVNEGVKGEEYTHTDDDGKDKKYKLNPQKQHTLTYGEDQIKAYIQHENEYTQYPVDPWLDFQWVTLIMDKIFSDLYKWKLKAESLKYDWIVKVAIAIGVAGGLYILYKLVVQPQITPQTIQTINDTVNTTIQIINNPNAPTTIV